MKEKQLIKVKEADDKYEYQINGTPNELLRVLSQIINQICDTSKININEYLINVMVTVKSLELMEENE